MRELLTQIVFDMIHTIPPENFKKNNLKFPFKTKFFSCILFLQDDVSLFPKLCAMFLCYDVKRATLDSHLYVIWIEEGK